MHALSAEVAPASPRSGRLRLVSPTSDKPVPDKVGNYLTEQVHSQTWCGVKVTAIEATLGPGRAWHKFASSTAVVTVVLKEVKGHCEARTNIHRPAETTDRSSATDGHLSIVPQGCDVWGYSDGVSVVHEARLFVDQARASEVFGERLDQVLDTPAFMKVDRTIHNIARLLALEVRRSSTELLYVEGLLAALFARLSAAGRPTSGETGGGGLTPRQLQLVKDFIAANVTENISLSELTDLVGLSRSQFGRAFKVSTGKSPNRWHREERLNLAKALLRDPTLSLVDIALTAGFSEQSHFNRVFRSLTGMTPGAWRRAH
jgi:AraC-like DNA-binding protein